MNDEHKVLVIPAVADRDAGGSWVAEVAHPASPFAGLFAWGDSFATARAGLAELAWAALSGAPRASSTPASTPPRWPPCGSWPPPARPFRWPAWPAGRHEGRRRGRPGLPVVRGTPGRRARPRLRGPAPGASPGRRAGTGGRAIGPPARHPGQVRARGLPVRALPGGQPPVLGRARRGPAAGDHPRPRARRPGPSPPRAARRRRDGTAAGGGGDRPGRQHRRGDPLRAPPPGAPRERRGDPGRGPRARLRPDADGIRERPVSPSTAGVAIRASRRSSAPPSQACPDPGPGHAVARAGSPPPRSSSPAGARAPRRPRASVGSAP